MTPDEQTMKDFAATAKCRRRANASPRINHEPGVTWIECDHPKCACRINDGDGLPLPEFVKKWEGRHGVNV